MADRLVPLVGVLLLGGAILMLLDHQRHRRLPERRRADAVKLAVFVAHVLVLLAAARLGRGAVLALLVLVAAGAGRELHRVWQGRLPAAGAALAAGLLLLALAHLLAGEDWQDAFPLAVVLVAANDAFAQLWGRLLGSRRLCPRLSPGKTVAGLLGGLATCTALAVAVGLQRPGVEPLRLLLLTLATAGAGTAGDLLFSAVKRAAGVKDFSGLLPSNGGLLDRFDSLILAAPAFHWTRTWLGI